MQQQSALNQSSVFLFCLLFLFCLFCFFFDNKDTMSIFFLLRILHFPTYIFPYLTVETNWGSQTRSSVDRTNIHVTLVQLVYRYFLLSHSARAGASSVCSEL